MLIPTLILILIYLALPPSHPILSHSSRPVPFYPIRPVPSHSIPFVPSRTILSHSSRPVPFYPIRPVPSHSPHPVLTSSRFHPVPYHSTQHNIHVSNSLPLWTLFSLMVDGVCVGFQPGTMIP